MSTLESAILAASKQSKLRPFLEALFTPRELKETRNRWTAIQLVAAGSPQRAIRKKLGIGIATASRAAKAMRDHGPVVRSLISKKNSG